MISQNSQNGLETLCNMSEKYINEALKMPLNANKEGHKSEPYKVFLENVDSFRTLDAMPVQLNFGDQGKIDTFMKYKAQWHKSC